MERFRCSLASLCGFASLLLAMSLAAPAFAETVKIVVPFAAGGPVDQLARILTPELAAKLKADVIVDDRGGAGGAIGSELVAHATPDGDTILLASMGSHVLGPILKPPTTYDPVKSFEPVMMVATMPSLAGGEPPARRRHDERPHRQGEGAKAHLRLGRDRARP